MSGEKYSQQQLKEIEEKINSVERAKCCSSPRKELLPDKFVLSVASNNLPAPGIDLISVICLNCGIAEQFSPVALGISQN